MNYVLASICPYFSTKRIICAFVIFAIYHISLIIIIWKICLSLNKSGVKKIVFIHLRTKSMRFVHKMSIIIKTILLQAKNRYFWIKTETKKIKICFKSIFIVYTKSQNVSRLKSFLRLFIWYQKVTR